MLSGQEDPLQQGNDSAAVAPSLQYSQLDKEGTLSPGSDDDNILDTSTWTATASASLQNPLLENDDTFVTLNPQVDDVNLDASTEHSVVEPTSELTDLPDMCSTKELVSDTSGKSILDIGEIYCKANSPAEFTTAMQSFRNMSC